MLVAYHMDTIFGGEHADRVFVWHRRRPEYWYGVAWLWEIWATVFFALALVWSVWRDYGSLATGHTAKKQDPQP